MHIHIMYRHMEYLMMYTDICRHTCTQTSLVEPDPMYYEGRVDFKTNVILSVGQTLPSFVVG